jgi:hypothetical protein
MRHRIIAGDSARRPRQYHPPRVVIARDDLNLQRSAKNPRAKVWSSPQKGPVLRPEYTIASQPQYYVTL